MELLQRALQRRSIAPAYLFAGPHGTGRALVAKCFCRDLLCLGLNEEQALSSRQRFLAGNHPDFLRVEPTYQHQGRFLTAAEARESGLKRKVPPRIRVEQVRDIGRFLSRPPLEAERSAVLIEEAHTMAEAAANALLKTLEEPGKATLILIAPSVESLLPTLVSRCQRIPFYRLSDENLERVLRENGHERVLQYPALLGLAQGSAGEAIAALEAIERLPENLPRSLDPLLDRKLSKALEIAKSIASSLDTEEQLWYLNYLQYEDWQKRRDRAIVEILEKTRGHLLAYVQPRLAWECALMELARR